MEANTLGIPIKKVLTIWKDKNVIATWQEMIDKNLPLMKGPFTNVESCEHFLNNFKLPSGKTLGTECLRDKEKYCLGKNYFIYKLNFRSGIVSRKKSMRTTLRKLILTCYMENPCILSESRNR